MELLLKLTEAQVAAIEMRRLQIINPRTGLPEFKTNGEYLVDQIETTILGPMIQQARPVAMAEAQSKMQAATAEYQAAQKRLSLVDFQEKV